MPTYDDFFGENSVLFEGPFVPTLTHTQAANERELLHTCPWGLVKQELFFKRAETIAQGLTCLVNHAHENDEPVFIKRLGSILCQVGKRMLLRLQDSIQYWKQTSPAGVPLWVYQGMLEPLDILGTYMKAEEWEEETTEPIEYSEDFLKLDTLTRGCVADLQDLPTPKIAAQIAVYLTRRAGKSFSKSDYDTLIEFRHRSIHADHIERPPSEFVEEAA
jgi:hypothetical protein